ncbi:MAG: hypothetical protein ACK4PR_03535 [Gammaproteobacteria bacterium]
MKNNQKLDLEQGVNANPFEEGEPLNPDATYGAKFINGARSAIAQCTPSPETKQRCFWGVASIAMCLGGTALLGLGLWFVVVETKACDADASDCITVIEP